MTTADLIGAVFAALLTLAVLSYLIGDNPVYRVAIHIFVGAAAGYAAIIVSTNILYPQLIAPVIPIVLGQSFSLETLILNLIIPAVLGFFLLMKAAPSTQRLGSFGTAFMIGVGVAVAIGGAIMGTLLPQTGATLLSVIPASLSEEGLENAFNSAVIILGTVVTLGFFYYGARAKPGGIVEQSVFVKPITILGQIFIGITFGVMYAGALASSLAIFTDRILELWSTIQFLIQG